MAIEVSIGGARNDALSVPGATYEAYSQSFASGSGFQLYSISLKMALATGSPGTIYCDIYAVDENDLPTGGLLGQASIAASSLNVFPSTSFPVFVFSPAVSLSASTQYCFVITVPGGSYGSHYVYLYVTYSGNPYVDGLMGRYDGVVWTTVATADVGGTIRSPEAYAEGTKVVTATATVSLSGSPGKATNPGPADNQEDIQIVGRFAINTFVWDAPVGETPDYLVYFRPYGGAWELQEVITDNSTSHYLSSAVRFALGYYSIYEWRVDTRDPDTLMVTTGDTWTFISQVSPGFTDFSRRSDYDADRVWLPGTGWVDINSFEFTGGGRYKGRIVVVGHKVIYFGDV